MAMNAFQHFLGQHSRKKVEILEKNHSIAEAIDGILDHLVSFCVTESIPIENIEIRDLFIAHDKRLQATITWHR